MRSGERELGEMRNLSGDPGNLDCGSESARVAVKLSHACCDIGLSGDGLRRLRVRRVRCGLG
jgi:hypothetical protein